jgi:hypothetical protein
LSPLFSTYYYYDDYYYYDVSEMCIRCSRKKENHIRGVVHSGVTHNQHEAELGTEGGKGGRQETQ